MTLHPDVPLVYECPRCKLFTKKKGNIRDHFNRKKPCVALFDNIVLTPEIIEHVLANKKYTPPVVTPPTPAPSTTMTAIDQVPPAQVSQNINNGINQLNQLINSNNTVYNYIINLDTIAKHTELLSYKNVEGMDFESHVDEKYEKTREKFSKEAIGRLHHQIDLKEQNFIDMVYDATISKKKDLSDMCVFYTQQDNRIFISVGGGTWNEMSCDEGTKTILYALVDYHHQKYEIAIIRFLEGSFPADHATAMQSLEDYYRFIASFDIPPSIRDKNDTQIMYNEDDKRYDDTILRQDIHNHRIVDKYCDIYMKVSDSITAAQKKVLCKRVLDEIKTTSKKNIRELNNTIMDIVKDKSNTGFRKKLVTTVPRK